MPVKMTLQVFKNGEPVGEYVSTVKAATTEQEAADYMLKNLRIDCRYRFLGARGFVIPTKSHNDYMLFNGGKA